MGDLSLVVSPPYDSVLPEEHRRLLARHPRNVVRLDLPAEEPGDEPDDRYRRAARTFAAWRSDGTFHKERRPSVYVYEQAYAVPGSAARRTQRGFFARLRLEPLEPGSGVLPQGPTPAGPNEDRYKLLRATGANFSPVVVLHDDPGQRASGLLDALATGDPCIDVTDDAGTRHRLWVASEEATAGEVATGEAAAAGPEARVGPVAELLALAGAGPLTIADGQAWYATALRYRDERRMTRSCEEDPPFDYVLALFLGTGQELTIAPAPDATGVPASGEATPGSSAGLYPKALSGLLINPHER